MAADKKSKPSDRELLAVVGPPKGKGWKDLTDDEIAALAEQMVDAMRERMQPSERNDYR